jgi:hypothetical protein
MFRASGVQGHRRDFLRIQDPLPTQGTSLSDFTQRRCCRCHLVGHQFKAYRVQRDIPRMEMVHHQDVAVELSTRLLTAQHEIETLRAQLRNADATIRDYRRMVDGQASDLYASDTDTWTFTSSVQSSSKEPAVSSHSPSGSCSR